MFGHEIHVNLCGNDEQEILLMLTRETMAPKIIVSIQSDYDIFFYYEMYYREIRTLDTKLGAIYENSASAF